MAEQVIYEKNLELLKERYTDTYYKLKETDCREDRVYIDKSVNDEDIIAVKRDSRLYYLNSRYNDEEFASRWISRYDKMNYKAVFIIFGLSNFRCAKKILEAIGRENVVLLYEPDKEIFIKSIQTVDITDILGSKNTLLCIKDINDNYLKEFITFGLEYSRMHLINYCCMPNYENLYMEEWTDLIKNIKSRCESIIMSRNTEILYSKEFIDNMLFNCEDMLHQYSLNQLRDKFREIDKLSEIPAIIVSAGPSLDKNIRDLKTAVGKAVIIAADTALKPLLMNGIKPDMVITVDAHKPPMLFMHSEFDSIPMIVCAFSNCKLWAVHSGRRFYFNDANSYMSHLYREVVGENLQDTETGGSVANNAFSVAQVLGFKKIIMIGQDLAYPDKKMHAEDVYGGAAFDNIVDNKKYFEVEDVYGGKILTEGNMDLYRKWFENQIVRYPNLKVIDATEGGAKIHGTEIMTLAEAVETECKASICTDEIINTIERPFNEEETLKLADEINSIYSDLEIAKKKINKGIRAYEKMEELFRRGKSGTKEFSRIVKELDEITKFVEEEPVLELAGVYNKIAEYEVLGQVYDVKNEIRDEIREISSQGIKMLNSYIEGINSLEEDIEKRKSVDKAEYEVINEKLIEIINKTDKMYKENNIARVNSLMVQYYQNVIELLNMLQLLQAESVDKSVNLKLKTVLDRIIKEHEEKKYSNMMEIMNNEFLKMLDDITDSVW